MSPLNTATVTASVLEKQIFDREGIHVILLCPRSTKFQPWPYQKATMEKFTLARFRDERLTPHLRASHGGKGVEAMIVKYPVEDLTNNGRWKLSNLRQVIRNANRAIAEALAA